MSEPSTKQDILDRAKWASREFVMENLHRQFSPSSGINVSRCRKNGHDVYNSNRWGSGYVSLACRRCHRLVIEAGRPVGGPEGFIIVWNEKELRG